MATLSASGTSISTTDLAAFFSLRMRRLSRCAAGFGAARERCRRDRRRGATSIAVSWNARSSSSSDTSPGRNCRSRICGTNVPCSIAGAAATGAGATAELGASRRWLEGAHAQFDQRIDQILIGAFGLGLGGLEACENFLDAIDAGKDQRDRFRRDRHAVAEFAHQRLAGMGQRFEARQAEEAAGALDGVNQPENVIQNLGVVRILLEPHQLIVDRIQALVGFRQELPQKIVHQNTPSKQLCCGLRSTVIRIRHDGPGGPAFILTADGSRDADRSSSQPITLTVSQPR